MRKFDYLFDETNNVVVKTYHGENTEPQWRGLPSKFRMAILS